MARGNAVADIAYLLSFIIIRIIRNMPIGQANSAKRLRAPLASAPKERPKNAIAAKRSSGAAQQIAMPRTPLSHPFPGIGQAAGPSVVFTIAPAELSAPDFPFSGRRLPIQNLLFAQITLLLLLFPFHSCIYAHINCAVHRRQIHFVRLLGMNRNRRQIP